jgi:uncharacterized protein related to proFAR isomerase
MKQKTAVELFATALYENGFLQGDGDRIQELLEQHLEMEKEQMIDFGAKCLQSQNETYGGNK